MSSDSDPIWLREPAFKADLVAFSYAHGLSGCRAETWFETPHGDRWSEPPRYCPSCGAKVMDE